MTIRFIEIESMSVAETLGADVTTPGLLVAPGVTQRSRTWSPVGA